MAAFRPTTPPVASTTVRPYSALAPLYDRIMTHVDYDGWADYLLSLCSRYGEPPRSVLELGCGTGNLTVRLSEALACRYLATDISEEMLSVAMAKIRPGKGPVDFQRADFSRLDVNGAFDLIVLAYDGVNYLLHDEEIACLLNEAAELLTPGGLFLFDQSTPANSINNLAHFDDRGSTEGASYVRTSRYDEDQRLHETHFEIRTGGESKTEVHFQRAYGLEEMELMLKLSSLRVESCLDAFSFMPATRESERVQWVLTGPIPATNSPIG